MKRTYLRSFCIDADTGVAFIAAQEKLRMSGSEIVNRLLLEWLLEMPPGSLTPPNPKPVKNAAMVQRASDIMAKEREIRKTT